MDLPSVVGVEFRAIPDFPSYAVSSDGRVWSCHSGKWRPLKGSKSGQYGHLSVCLCDHPRRRREFIHRLVLEAFVGPCPEGMEGRHFPDRNTENNAASNLQWSTHIENCGDRIIHGVDYRGEGHHWRNENVTPEAVKELRRLHAGGKTLVELSVMFPKILKPNIWCIVHGKSWKHVI